MGSSRIALTLHLLQANGTLEYILHFTIFVTDKVNLSPTHTLHTHACMLSYVCGECLMNGRQFVGMNAPVQVTCNWYNQKLAFPVCLRQYVTLNASHAWETVTCVMNVHYLVLCVVRASDHPHTG